METADQQIKTKTLKVRVRDKHAPLLKKMSRSVNFVWNYINELSFRNIRERNAFLSAFDIQKYTNGAGRELGIHSQTVQCVAKEYTTRRKQFKKAKLAWRVSKEGPRKSHGWIPINTKQACWKNGQVYHNGHYFKVKDTYGLSQYDFRTASFNQDARGRWYFNVTVSYTPEVHTGSSSVGIDLGCKEAATCSDGTKLEGRWYRGIEEKLGKAQRANKKKEVKNIHAKASNRRKDVLHKVSRVLVNSNAAIFVGNVSSKGLSKTKMAKSVLDAGWGMFKQMLEYKCDHAGIIFEVIDEKYTTQTCSSCGEITSNSPKGRTGLGIREWICRCGAKHDRDINAARNILALGHGRLAEGITALGGVDVNITTQ